jgi:hypothetical protein
MATNLPNRLSTTDYLSLGGNGIKVILPADNLVNVTFCKLVPLGGAAVLHTVTPIDGYTYDTRLNGESLPEGSEWPIHGCAIRVTSGKVVVFLR